MMHVFGPLGQAVLNGMTPEIAELLQRPAKYTRTVATPNSPTNITPANVA